MWADWLFVCVCGRDTSRARKRHDRPTAKFRYEIAIMLYIRNHAPVWAIFKNYMHQLLSWVFFVWWVKLRKRIFLRHTSDSVKYSTDFSRLISKHKNVNNSLHLWMRLCVHIVIDCRIVSIWIRNLQFWRLLHYECYIIHHVLMKNGTMI